MKISLPGISIFRKKGCEIITHISNRNSKYALRKMRLLLLQNRNNLQQILILYHLRY
jgi:hypothetical protein